MMRIDLNCPAEIVSYEILREEDPQTRLILMDLTDRGIDSCEATVRLMDRDGAEIARTVHRARALHGRPHSTFPMRVPMEIPEGAVRAEATLDKVWFEDHDVWRRDPRKEREYEPNALGPGNDLNALKYVAGDLAVGFPSQQAQVWVCVCGRPNGNEENICARCRRQREMIFQQYNRNAVLRQVNLRERQLDLQTRGAREEAALLQRAREAEYDRKKAKAKRIRRVIVSMIALIAAVAVCVFAVIPGIRLWQADTALKEDRLEEAREMLTELGSFPGAESRLAEAEIRIARRDGELAAASIEAFDLTKMAELASFLRKTGDGEADAALADRVDLSRAQALLANGEYAQAEKLLNALPEELAGREALLRDCAFARAENAMEAKKYEEAREIYLSLGDYPGAAEKALQAVYEPALAMMENGEYDEAIAAFGQISGYQDSAALIQQCWYLKGYTLEEQGETEAARQAYLTAGDYEDAPERAKALRWKQAGALLAVEDYEAALPLYRELDGYEDARAKWLQCATAMARKAYKQREYIVAVSWLEDLPEDTKEIVNIRTRGLYLGAKAAASRGELEEAIAMMERVATYSDAGKNIRNWRMTLARQKMEEGLYEEAKELLAPVAENYNVQRLLKEIEKAQEALQAEAAAQETEETSPSAAEEEIPAAENAE